ncbi:uncharacterized protein LOC142907900 [Petromyzon marinus]|uniref:uncharacterized protein LOC142907900 n=1 Tax=Petromyzon marinus TaxID=7757 RepID=UPI003F706088
MCMVGERRKRARRATRRSRRRARRRRGKNKEEEEEDKKTEEEEEEGKKQQQQQTEFTDAESKELSWGLGVRQAISFCEGGRSFLDVFSPPRPVTYFLNLLGPTSGPVATAPAPASPGGIPNPAQHHHHQQQQKKQKKQQQQQKQKQQKQPSQASLSNAAQQQQQPASPASCPGFVAPGGRDAGGGVHQHQHQQQRQQHHQQQQTPPSTLEGGLACPRGSSPELAALINDALLMRIIVAKGGGVRVPETLAFVLPPPRALRPRGLAPGYGPAGGGPGRGRRPGGAGEGGGVRLPQPRQRCTPSQGGGETLGPPLAAVAGGLRPVLPPQLPRRR